MQRSLLMRAMAHRGSALMIAGLLGLVGCSPESGDVECCPIGGNCDRYYVGGDKPASGECEAWADLLEAREKEPTAAGCPRVEPLGGKSCFFWDSGLPKDTMPADAPDAADSTTDAADSTTDAADSTTDAADSTTDARSDATDTGDGAGDSSDAAAFVEAG